jgi:hypothetical protein
MQIKAFVNLHTGKYMLDLFALGCHVLPYTNPPPSQYPGKSKRNFGAIE